MKRARLLAAVRDQMRSRATTHHAEERPPAAKGPRATPTRRPSAPDGGDEIEQLAAEARYHCDRYDLYRARVMTGNAATSLTRLRQLERTATAASDRLAHARRSRRPAAEQPRDDTAAPRRPAA